MEFKIFLITYRVGDPLKKLIEKIKQYSPNGTLSDNQISKIKTLIEYFDESVKDISVILETKYVDKSYRDTFYSYFASKHANIERDCLRLLFFAKKFSYDDFLSGQTDMIAQAFMCSVVLRPIRKILGKTLINPKWIKKDSKKYYIRTTQFSVSFFGQVINVDAFPYMSQDSEVMTCAEVSIWNILEYYGNRYPEYKTVLPSELQETISDNSFERSLPSSGLGFAQCSKSLKNFGLSPKIYSRETYGNDDDFRRILHYYIESGIPVFTAIHLESVEKTMNEQGHAIVCIGHTDECDMEQVSLIKKYDLNYINSADFFKHYVFMDDNKLPYTVNKFDNVAGYFIADGYKSTTVKHLIAPLYKRIFMDADSAFKIAESFFTDADLGILKAISKRSDIEYSDSNPIVVRFFLTSGRKYKAFRARHHVNKRMQLVLGALVSLPKFVWVAELSTKKMYNSKKIIGEILIDATASPYDLRDSITYVYYPSYLYVKNKDCANEIQLEKLNAEHANSYPMYINNLLEYS